MQLFVLIFGSVIAFVFLTVGCIGFTMKIFRKNKEKEVERVVGRWRERQREKVSEEWRRHWSSSVGKKYRIIERYIWL